MIFVDTGAWYAANVPRDTDFAVARQFLAANREPLATTDYVIDELLTLLCARREFQRALKVGQGLLLEGACRIEWVTPADVFQAWSTYRSYHDKSWSFTDCVSWVVMERLGILQAFTFDEHFRQFGNLEVVP